MLFRISLSGSEIAVSTILTAARNHFDEKLKLLLGQIIQDLSRQLHIFQIFFIFIFLIKCWNIHKFPDPWHWIALKLRKGEKKQVSVPTRSRTRNFLARALSSRLAWPLNYTFFWSLQYGHGDSPCSCSETTHFHDAFKVFIQARSIIPEPPIKFIVYNIQVYYHCSILWYYYH